MAFLDYTGLQYYTGKLMDEISGREAETIAPEWKQNKPYIQGAYVTIDGETYMAENDIAANTPFSNGPWKKTTLGENLHGLQENFRKVLGLRYATLWQKGYYNVQTQGRVGGDRSFLEQGDTWEFEDPRNRASYNASTNFYAAYLPCAEGQVAHIWVYGGKNARAWGFLNANGEDLGCAPRDAISDESGEFVQVAPANTAWVYANTNITEIPVSQAYLAVEKAGTRGLKTQDAIADRYDSTNVYSAGEMAFHADTLKKYDGSAWTETDIGSQVTALNREVEYLLYQVTDQSGNYTEGAYPAGLNGTVGTEVISLDLADFTTTANNGQPSAFSATVLPCKTGDSFTVTCVGGGAPRAWAFLDTDRVLKRVSNSGASPSNRTVTAEEDGWFICCHQTASAFKLTARQQLPVEAMQSGIICGRKLVFNSDGTVGWTIANPPQEES